MNPLEEAGLVLERSDDGSRLRIFDSKPEGCCDIRNRGGEILARLLLEDRRIRVLDISDSRISDNGMGHIALALRQTDQLEELYLSPLGHCGLEFVLGVVNRCDRLRCLSVKVADVPTLVKLKQNLDTGDYDVASYEAPKGEDEEEEEEAPEDEDAPPKETKADKLRKIFAENDYISDEEGEATAKDRAPGGGTNGGPSVALSALLAKFVEATKCKENLLEARFEGEVVPADLKFDLRRVMREHCAAKEKIQKRKEEKSARTALDALKDQMEELRRDLEVDESGNIIDEAGEAVEDAEAAAFGDNPEVVGEGTNRIGMRAFVNRRLFAALGQALFECQRFKAKENAAVSTPEGEMAFVAMHLRRQVKEWEEQKGGARGR